MNETTTEHESFEEKLAAVFHACPVCGATLLGADWGNACAECSERYPPSLIKACSDQPFDYAMLLRTGQVIRFEGAEIHGAYATLTLDCETQARLPFPFPRGLDVRISDIVWCADAPNGS